MTNKQLEDKAVDIKGKKYVLVSDRVVYFNETYPNGCIESELLSDTESQRVVFKTTVTPDVANPSRKFTGYAQETVLQV